MAGRPKYTAAELIQKGVEWINANERWPLCNGGPVNYNTVQRHFGCWTNYMSELRRAYEAEHGRPAWDERRPRIGTAKAQLMADTVEAMEGAIARISAMPPVKASAVAQTASKDPSELMLLISDVHVGEYNDPALMGGITGPEGYCFSVFQESANTLESKVLFFKRLYSKGWNINKLVVNFLGDLVTGEQIFLGQALQIDRIVTDQIFYAAHRFASMVRTWAKHFPEVEVYCMPGNHGRLGKKGELHWRSNMDYIAYRVMSILLADVPHVRFVIAAGPFLVVEHGNDWRFLIHHGDSIPGGGVTKGNLVNIERKVHHFSQMADLTIHYSLSAHFHRSASLGLAGGGRIISNGSFPGGSPYSINELGDAQIPSQKLLLFSPDKGVHSETDIILGPRPGLRRDSNRVYTDNYSTT